MHKLRISRKFQRASLYKKSIILFSLCMLVLTSVFLIYVYKSMALYERNLVDNYIFYLASSDKLTAGVNDNLFIVSKYEKSNAKISDGVKKLYKSDDLKIKKNSKESTNDIFAYDLYNGDKLISTVSIKSKNSYKRMAILTINEWEIVSNKNYFDEGVYAYEITIPGDYKLYINDKEVDASDILKEGDVEGLESLTKYIEISKSKTYIINNLVYEPNIKILDEKTKEIAYKKEDNKIVVEKEFIKVNSYEDAKVYIKNDFDVLKFAEHWSLFLTKDYSFEYLKPYFIKDSYMYERANTFAHGVDIQFTSNHCLKNPTFTNELVENCVIYNENAFSCEVSLEKNMVVSGNDRIDTMHERLYFIYYNDGYKLVNMEAITE